MSPIKFAVAVAIASAAATSAYALDASSSLAAGTVQIYVGGSTAVDNTLLATETALTTLGPGGMCQTGTIDVYQIGNPSNRLTYCTGSASLPAGLANQPLAFFKESSVGSFNGPGPLVGIATTPGPFTLNFLNAGTPGVAGSSQLTAANCPTVSSSDLGANFNAFTLHQCNTSAGIVTPRNPTGGIADVEANLLKDPNGRSFPANLIGQLSGAAGLDVVWGVGVTKNLYYALQHAEHLDDGTVIAACNVANNDSPACAPSMSKSQVASAYQAVGLIGWNQILGLSNPTGDNNVYLCRRDDGSGTEASFEAYFLGARCGGPTNPSGSKIVMPAEDGQFVFTSGSTGNVRNCLQAFFGGGNATTSTGATVHENGNQWAIGVLSSEVTAGNLVASGSNLCNDCFRMVAVDGVLPTLANVANGYWPYWSTDVFYTTSTGPDAATGNPLAGFRAVQGKMGHPAFTAITNASFAGRPWGSGGDLAPASVFAATNPPAIPATSATQATNPTNGYTKASTGGVSNCDTPVLQSGLNTPTQNNLLGSGNVNH